ncbi:Riboflavin transporter RfnT [Roseovarius sp. EC-HK134]|jgi:MFS family permease|uniref:Major facilitator superfamily protein n=1 Tax=Roseovarius mucosus TaxID=215743 RepID=A0A1V0RKH6_9RHOB|nr:MULTISPECIES: MFS transporter [Roseovarius]ARE82175.1 major facilitator superfamily protein [Roseovarius mucosus]AWZ22216.1 Putative membrane protein [Roseovarius sp. AK1035]EDM30489.1 transporter, putative [Roseovarius sp. TM1035]MBW4972499.1 MFS transporter [Roseovarius mucosus]VVT26195.1 Riboflavin transporter RfnT [Roseovarius sp. EC-HK134]
MTDIALHPDDSRAKRNVAVLVAAQAILGAQMPMIFVVGGLAGQSLASNICFATLPISLIVLGSMLSATPISHLMQRYGRRTGFFIGAGAGALGGAIGAYGLYTASFPIFLLGSLITGTYMSAQGFYRFAAADTASDAFRAKAISYVMAGGLLSAVIGPQLVKATSQAMVIPFLGTYLAVIALNIAGAFLFLLLDIPKPPQPAVDAPHGRTRMELLKTPRIAVAVICATVSYALMNLVMTSTPLAVVGCGFDAGNAADVVTAHVLAMYIPSFFTGHLIARFGVEKIVAIGLVILAGAGAVALNGVHLENFFVALILLGIGWNFGFIGATTMLAGAHEPQERGRMQGLNDLIVFGGVTFASLSSGGLMNCSGGTPEAGWTAVNLAMAPFLMLAGGALIWLTLRPKEA